MPKIIWAIFILSLSFNAFAGLDEEVRNLNATARNVGNQPCLTCNIEGPESKKDSGALMRSCVEAICSNKDFFYDKIVNESY